MKYFMPLIFIFNTSCYDVQRDCEAFKTGTFQSNITIDGQTFVSKFERTTDLQIEQFDGQIDSSSVRWINDCEMIFRTLNPKSRIEKKDIHLKILSTSTTSYTFEYGYVGDSKKQKGVAKRMD